MTKMSIRYYGAEGHSYAKVRINTENNQGSIVWLQGLVEVLHETQQDSSLTTRNPGAGEAWL